MNLEKLTGLHNSIKNEPTRDLKPPKHATLTADVAIRFCQWFNNDNTPTEHYGISFEESFEYFSNNIYNPEQK